jgi:hypothetical protein
MAANRNRSPHRSSGRLARSRASAPAVTVRAQKRAPNNVIWRCNGARLPLDGERAPASCGVCPRCNALLGEGIDGEPACMTCGYHDYGGRRSKQPAPCVCPNCHHPLRPNQPLYTAVDPDSGELRQVCTWCEAVWAHRREHRQKAAAHV